MNSSISYIHILYFREMHMWILFISSEARGEMSDRLGIRRVELLTPDFGDLCSIH
jgi:hypothetical protein